MANTAPPSGKEVDRFDKPEIERPVPLAGGNRANSKSQRPISARQRSRRRAKLSRAVLKAARDWLAPRGPV